MWLGPPSSQMRMTEVRRFDAPLASRARNNCGKVTLAIPATPSCKKLRRVSPSQYRPDRPKSSRNIPKAPLGLILDTNNISNLISLVTISEEDSSQLHECPQAAPTCRATNKDRRARPFPSGIPGQSELLGCRWPVNRATFCHRSLPVGLWYAIPGSWPSPRLPAQQGQFPFRPAFLGNRRANGRQTDLGAQQIRSPGGWPIRQGLPAKLASASTRPDAQDTRLDCHFVSSSIKDALPCRPARTISSLQTSYRTNDHLLTDVAQKNSRPGRCFPAACSPKAAS